MKSLALTVMFYILMLGLVWMTGWLLISDWYSQRFSSALPAILNYTLLPAILTTVICVLAELIMSLLSVNTAIQLLLMFGMRVMLMISLSVLAYMVYFRGAQASKIDKVAFVLTAFCYYIAILAAHVASSIIGIMIKDRQNR